MSTADTAKRFESLIRMVRVARQMEMGGFYNAAKLLWAAAFSEEIRASNEGNLQADLKTLDSDFAAAIDDIRAMGASPEVLAALDTGRNSVRDNKGVPYEQIPAVHVCRVCGTMALGDVPDQCAGCGGFELIFRTFPPVHYLDPLPPSQALRALTSVPSMLHKLIDGLGDDLMNQPPRPGEWSIREVLLHFHATQELLSYRVGKMLRSDSPSLAATGAVLGDDSLSTADVLASWEKSRSALAGLLNGISDGDWWRTGWHEEFGSVTIVQQVSYFAKHDHAHLTQIESVRRVVGGG